MPQKKKSRGRGRQITIYQKTSQSTGKVASKRKKSHRQTGRFLNRYDFAYACRDVVNQVGKVTPKMMNQATGENYTTEN